MEKIIVEKVRELKGMYNELNEKFEGIKKITSDFNYTNLKLHHASYYLYNMVNEGLLTNQQAESLFNHMCECEYMYFQEWETDCLNYVSREYIGRTSSFYYLTTCYGEIIETYDINTLLQGEDLDIMDFMEQLPEITYNALFEESDDNMNDLVKFVESELEEMEESEYNKEEFVTEFFEDAVYFFNQLSLDLELLNDIVEEAKQAYDYLDDFKSENNEVELIKQYLTYELTEVLASEVASDIFTELLFELDKLNKVSSINVKYIVNDVETYSIEFELNDYTLISDTDISIDVELSKMYIEQIIYELNKLLQSKF